MLRFCKCLAVALVAFALLGTTAQAGTFWKLSHVRPTDTPADNAANFFGKRIAELTDGDISINVFPNSQLGDWPVVQQRISLGAVEMALQTVDSQVDKRLSALYFPYLFNSLEQTKANMVPGAPFRVEMEKLLKEQNIYPLAFWPSYFGGLAFKTEPKNWDKPDQPKGLKIRIPNDPAYAANAQAMGYLATPIAFSDTYTSIQTGVVDGIIGSGGVGYYYNFRDIVKYYLPLNDHLEMYVLMLNLDKWKSLDKETQAKFTQVAAEMETARYAQFKKDEAFYRDELKQSGITTLPVTPELIKGYAKLAQEQCWPALAEKIDKKFIDHLMSLVKS